MKCTNWSYWILGLLLMSAGLTSAETLKEQLNKAKTLFQQEDYEQALEIYDQILNATPTIQKARIEKARCLSRLDRRSQAMEELDYVLRSDPDNRDALLAKGSNWARLGNHVKAIFLFKQILKKHPMDVYALYNLGTSQREVTQYKAALNSFFKIYDLQERSDIKIPKQLRALLPYQIGLIYMNQLEFDKAKKYLHQAVKESPWLENAQYQLGMAYARSGDAQKSRQWLDSFRKLKDTRKKIKRMQHAASEHPQAATPYIGMGQLYISIGNMEKAQISLMKALDRDGNNPHALTYMGLLYLRSDQIKPARQMFEAALQSDSRNVLALVNLGSLELKEGNLTKAEVYFYRALQIEPRFRLAQQGYQRVQQLKQEREDESYKDSDS